MSAKIVAQARVAIEAAEKRIDELEAELKAERAKAKLEREGAAKLLEFVSQTQIPAEGPIGPPIRKLLEGTARAIRSGIHVLPSNRWPLPGIEEREPQGIAKQIEAMMKQRGEDRRERSARDREVHRNHDEAMRRVARANATE